MYIARPLIMSTGTRSARLNWPLSWRELASILKQVQWPLIFDLWLLSMNNYISCLHSHPSYHHLSIYMYHTHTHTHTHTHRYVFHSSFWTDWYQLEGSSFEGHLPLVQVGYHWSLTAVLEGCLVNIVHLVNNLIIVSHGLVVADSQVEISVTEKVIDSSMQ